MRCVDYSDGFWIFLLSSLGVAVFLCIGCCLDKGFDAAPHGPAYARGAYEAGTGKASVVVVSDTAVVSRDGKKVAEYRIPAEDN